MMKLDPSVEMIIPGVTQLMMVDEALQKTVEFVQEHAVLGVANSKWNEMQEHEMLAGKPA